MGALFEKLKSLLLSKPLPTDAQEALKKADSMEALVLELERSITRNEMELKRLENELAELEKMEQKEAAKIKEGVGGERVERTILRRIRRLRMRMESLEQQMDTLERNAMALTQLLTRVRQVRAMEKVGVTEEQVDEVMEAYEAQQEEWQEMIEMIEGAGAGVQAEAEDEEELEELKKEILREKPKKKVKEKPKKAVRKEPEQPEAAEE